MAVMVAFVVVGVMVPSMMQLALTSAQASWQKSSYALAQANAIAVWKQVAGHESLPALMISEGCV